MHFTQNYLDFSFECAAANSKEEKLIETWMKCVEDFAWSNVNPLSCLNPKPDMNQNVG